jgi:hypothetical protein
MLGHLPARPELDSLAVCKTRLPNNGRPKKPSNELGFPSQHQLEDRLGYLGNGYKKS